MINELLQILKMKVKKKLKPMTVWHIKRISKTQLRLQ